MKRHLNTLYILGMVILAGVFSACSKEDQPCLKVNRMASTSIMTLRMT